MATQKSCKQSSKKVADPKKSERQDLDRGEAEQDDYVPKENDSTNNSCDD